VEIIRFDSKRLYRRREVLRSHLKKRILVQDRGKMALPQLPYWLPAAILLLSSPIFV
jgi:hypothetical protein